MKLTRVALMTGLLVVPAMLLTGCGNQEAKRSGADNNIKNVKAIVASLKETFAAGSTVPKDDANARGSVDNRMAVVAVLVTDKIPYTVNKRVSDDTKRKATLAKLDETGKFLTKTVIPKYTEAQASGKAEDAKALIPLMEQLEQRLDEVVKALD
jgi:hypothetical protein